LPETVAQGVGVGTGRAVAVSAPGDAAAVDLGIPTHPMPLAQALEGPERAIIEMALKRNNWNRQATAAELDINRTTLYKKMRRYKLDVGEMNWV
jgi:DNA-binding NtrC family response regulator